MGRKPRGTKDILSGVLRSHSGSSPYSLRSKPHGMALLDIRSSPHGLQEALRAAHALLLFIPVLERWHAQDLQPDTDPRDNEPASRMWNELITFIEEWDWSFDPDNNPYYEAFPPGKGGKGGRHGKSEPPNYGQDSHWTSIRVRSSGNSSSKDTAAFIGKGGQGKGCLSSGPRHYGDYCYYKGKGFAHHRSGKGSVPY